MKQYYGKGLKHFYFFDDTFILDKKFVTEFCKRYKTKGYHLLVDWNVNVRANLVDDELIRTMKDAGCYQIRMGVETGNEYIRNKVYHRDMTNNQIYNAIEIIHKNKVQLRLYFMIGAPYETIEMMNESLKLAQRSKADENFFGLLYPLPGTEIRSVCEQEQISITYEGGNRPVNRTKFTSNFQLKRFMKKVQRWQIKKYIIDGLKLRGVLFLLDCLLFLIYYKQKYDFELNQLFRWNVQRYKLKRS
jgi:radical SAM superfamily enzyme YgiQ (UPF0313 family)